ncbi:MAG: glycosyltransferase, partial [Planctomycetes bacterium]|nr:glycosyltransferase [Planctomycetota bacterium]
VLTPSQDVLDDVRCRNPRARLLPHGVDLAHFARALDEATPLPADLAAIPRPRIGFFGVVDEKWLDLALLEWLARQRPAWCFVLVGALVNVDPTRWASIPNLRWLGWRPYESLPGYCRGFAAGIIPFAASELTRKARPLKMKEYLAAGLPAISTVPPETGYERVVRHAPSREAFLAALDAVVATGTAAGREERLASVRGDSWDARAEEA